MERFEDIIAMIVVFGRNLDVECNERVVVLRETTTIESNDGNDGNDSTDCLQYLVPGLSILSALIPAVRYCL